MGALFDSISAALDATYRLPHETNPAEIDKLDLKAGAQVIVDPIDLLLQAKVLLTATLLTARDEPASASMLYCKETNLFYKYKADVSAYIEYGNTLIPSNISGGWVEHDSLNKFMNASSVISIEHNNQSSAITLTSPTDFTAKPDQLTNNGHTHVCKVFCNGIIPTFSGFSFMPDSSPIDIATIDTAAGYYHTVVFFKLADANRYIILEKVLSNDVTPPTIIVSVSSKTDTSITYSISTDENAEVKWALYGGGSSTKTTAEIDNGTGAIQFGVKAVATGANSLQLINLSELTTYDLWQYAKDVALNATSPAKTTVQTNAGGTIQLTAPSLGLVTILGPTSLSVPILASMIDSRSESVSVFYKRGIDSIYTEIAGIGIADISHTITGLTANTQYNVYLVNKGDVVNYTDSAPSNTATQTTQNVAPTLGIPYTDQSGLVIELPFSRQMANPSAQTALFTPSGGRTVVSSLLKNGDSSKIQVTVNSAYLAGDTITITIASGLVPADNGVVYGGVSNQAVTNNLVSLSYPTGYVALHSAQDSVIDYTSKTISDLSGNNRPIVFHAETTPASNGGLLANSKGSVLFPAGTAFKFPNYVCGSTSGFAHAHVFNIKGNNSACGFGSAPRNYVGRITNETLIYVGATLKKVTTEPSTGDIMLFAVTLRDSAGTVIVQEYIHNLTTNTVLINTLNSTSFANITANFGIGEVLISGAINGTLIGEQNWQHSIFYERGLDATEFTQMIDKVLNDYLV